MLITVCLIFDFIVFAQYTASYKLYVINTDGHLEPVDGVLHIDINDTTKFTKETLYKNNNGLFRKPKAGPDPMELPYREQQRSKDDYIDITHLINRSPVVYSNGRYTLDLDKIDVRDIQDTTAKPPEQEYYDPEENFRDYYDYIGVNDRLRSDRKKWEKLKRLTKFIKTNLRRHNKLKNSKEQTVRRGQMSFEKKKRFAVIDNGSPKDKSRHESGDQKKLEHKPYITSENVIEELTDNEILPKDTIESDESPEYDDGVYLQGNTLVKFNGQTNEDENSNKDKSNDSSNKNISDESSASEDTGDGRRRLPHFLPKRYHWDKDDLKNLGTYWFEGYKGRYPEPRPLY